MTQFIQPNCSPGVSPRQPNCSPGVSPGQQNNTGGPETRRQQNDTRGKYCTFINEPGFYELVFRFKLETAKKFRYWVFSKVLPSIRKYGYYKLFDTIEKQRVLFGEKKNTINILCLVITQLLKMETS